MSVWKRLFGIEEVGDQENVPDVASLRLAFIDTEVSTNDHKVHDIGIVRYDGAIFHSASRSGAVQFLEETDYLCGHNIVHHDAKYLFADKPDRWRLVDTLYLSPLLFPERPYHRLVKDDKWQSEQINNPVNDCQKARDLLMDEINQWFALSQEKRRIYATLLAGKEEFKGFLKMVGTEGKAKDVVPLIRRTYEGKICSNADFGQLISNYPCELAYALALADTPERGSITPGWVLHQFPAVETVMKALRHHHCQRGCPYCRTQLDIHQGLKMFFGYDVFRTYEGEPLQERACQAAADGESLLAIFPTGGGKSLTFQLPALMEGRTLHGLTVVISPLQSLMKDQVDNLVERGITEAVYINGLLDPIERANSLERVMNGEVSLLYISPEMLRSSTIGRILLARHVVRFVIDEAHCFSAWGQDFRVDYLYIARFIREYQEQKNISQPIPVSCFTATAKQKVTQDIRDYFEQELHLHLELFASSASRSNLSYSVIHTDSDEDKYIRLRSLVTQYHCPTIIYVSRTKRTRDLAAKLTRDGYKALPFNGRMDSQEKMVNQDAFMKNEVGIIVATSAFGMGVDKRDVELVIHYDISDSLENYVQEAGRAGRAPNLSACCYVLYGDDDLDKHFILLNQTKLSIKEINQVWSAVKKQTRQRPRICCSALELARQAGWDDSVTDIETRVRTALAALEQAGYIERGTNSPRVYATGITVRNMDEARKRLSASQLFEEKEVENAARIFKSLISKKYCTRGKDEDAESRVDYIADMLGLSRKDVISTVNRMTQEGILGKTRDVSAYLYDEKDTEQKVQNLLNKFGRLEQFLLQNITSGEAYTSYRELNDNAVTNGIKTSREKDIKTLLYFLVIKGYVKKTGSDAQALRIARQQNLEQRLQRFEKRMEICRFAVEWLYKQAVEETTSDTQQISVHFSVVELLEEIQQNGQSLFTQNNGLQLEDVEEALLYLSKIGAMKLEGGFMVLYNAMNIRRLKDNQLRYKQEDYRLLNEFYKLKMQQIHIVGEYANLMVKDYNAALQYVHDYFAMDYRRFIAKYFKGERIEDIQRNLSPKKYKQLFAQLSKRQMEIISDKTSRCIVVAAGPGSGKTRVLVHKLASLFIQEDVKHEQLLMLTFSRAAAMEFKLRLMELIGNAAHFVEIKTFHAYCFDLLGLKGNLEEAGSVVATAAEQIRLGEVEPSKIGKTVLVIDEAQDMGPDDYALVKALMDSNEDMRVIAVGDDAQNIYEFRGSSSQYMFQLTREAGARFIEMTENYRSTRHIVDAANALARNISHRMKRTPITSMSQENGWVEITRHTSSHLFIPLAEDILQRHASGNTCILTQTNEEAVIMVALLHKYGIKSKLVQSMDGLRFWNIAEVRYFLKQLTACQHTPLIDEEVWEQAKAKTFDKYASSLAFPYLRRCLELFEKANERKYYSDLKEYIFESTIEDFCEASSQEVVVSTIHKSKGREFDNVYMLVAGMQQPSDELWRRFYVGITRARKRLIIHTDTHAFDHIKADLQNVNQQEYPMPEEIALQLSHKDVNLGFFKERKNEVLSLHSGDALLYQNTFLYHPASGLPVAQLSKKMQDTLSAWQSKGYEVKAVRVRFIVAWKPRNAPKEEQESAVLLADLSLRKKATQA